jgi:hypothetical protein
MKIFTWLDHKRWNLLGENNKNIPGAEFLDEIQTKVSRVSSFLFRVTSTVYSFALRFLFLQTHATSYSFYSVLVYNVMGERRKT